MRLKITGLLTAVTLTIVAGTTPVTAQWRTEPVLPMSRAPSVAVDPPVLRLPDSRRFPAKNDLMLALAGVAGAAVGSLGGAYVGYHLDHKYYRWDCENGCEDPGVWGAYGGWFVGSALTTPLSVHLANRGRGSLTFAYVSSALIGGAGMAGSLALPNPESGFVLLGTPLAQVISAVLIERRGAR